MTSECWVLPPWRVIWISHFMTLSPTKALQTSDGYGTSIQDGTYPMYSILSAMECRISGMFPGFPY